MCLTEIDEESPLPVLSLAPGRASGTRSSIACSATSPRILGSAFDESSLCGMLNRQHTIDHRVTGPLEVERERLSNGDRSEPRVAELCIKNNSFQGARSYTILARDYTLKLLTRQESKSRRPLEISRAGESHSQSLICRVNISAAHVRAVRSFSTPRGDCSTPGRERSDRLPLLIRAMLVGSRRDRPGCV
jgi:hypothetical protein